MSKSWYPVINYELCAQCGACVEKCSHGVYNKAKAPRPVVVFPEGCVQGCHGCGNLCPNGAIEYFGDIKEADMESCGCGCGSDSSQDCGCGQV
jgi:NAD-dependent dihydropyrimidine dehydrogenase PreA subunit